MCIVDIVVHEVVCGVYVVMMTLYLVMTLLLRYWRMLTVRCYDSGESLVIIQLHPQNLSAVSSSLM